ncbi:MAG: DNA polymerase III subunit gamma/tau [Thermoguttaceae bacterium]|jgi:DNA polymerase-3 subunit gamma/tau
MMAEDLTGQEQSDSGNEKETSYQVVARRYRPQGFDALIGQEHVAKTLKGAITSGRIGHAYLFAGARGVGKTSSARILAKALNCVHGPTPAPCNECDLCRAIGSGEDIDVLEIDGASNRGIDEIRQLRQNATIRPSRARYKIYIIDEVHMLTREAFNALLKILEEPPGHVKFIFCTTEPNKLPITILSRCQRFDFAGINAQMIAEHLRYIATNEGISTDAGVCETLARRANGSMRDAQSLLEQLLSFVPVHITMADVNGMLGTVDDQKIFDLIDVIKNDTPADLFPILTKAAGEGVDFGVLLEQMVGIFRDLLVVSCGCQQDALLYSDPSRFETLKDIAGVFGTERLLASIQVISQTISRMRYTTQGQILAEITLVRLCSLGRLTDAVRLIEQLRSGRIPSPMVDVPATGSLKKIPDLNPSAADALPASGRPKLFSTEFLGMTSARQTNTPVNSPNTAAPPPRSEESLPEDPPTVPKPSLDSLDYNALLVIWRNLSERFGVSLSSATRACTRLEWTGSVLRIGFPPNAERDQAVDICQKGIATISSTLSEFVSETQIPIEIFRTNEPLPASPAKPKPKRVSQTAKFDELRKKSGTPMVKDVEKMFGGKLEYIRDSSEGTP